MNTDLQNTKERILKLFPMKVKVTSKEYKDVDIYDRFDCIGARTLKKALGRRKGIKRCTWGAWSGHIELSNSSNTLDRICIDAFDLKGNKVEMMEIKRPRILILKVIFR